MRKKSFGLAIIILLMMALLLSFSGCENDDHDDSDDHGNSENDAITNDNNKQPEQETPVYYFTISSSKDIVTLGVDNEVKMSVKFSDDLADLNNIETMEIQYVFDGNDNADSSISGNTVSIHELGAVRVKGYISSLDLYSKNTVTIMCDNSAQLIQDKLSAILKEQPIFGQTYDIGLNKSKLSSYTIEGAEGAMTINEEGLLEIIGRDTGKFKIKDGENVIFEGRFSVFNSILCTAIKEELVKNGIIEYGEGSFTADMLKHVKALNLSAVLVNDPTSIHGLKYLENLEEVNLSDNNIDDFSFVSNLRNLKVIKASNNNISNIEGIIENEELWYLDISNNNISDLSEFQYFENIKYLNISDNKVENINYLSSMFKIESLFMNNNKISNFKDPLSSLVLLRELGLGYCGLEFNDIMSLNFLNQLDYLDVSGTSASLLRLSTLTNLKTLIVRDCNLSRSATCSMGSLTSLEKLDISNNSLQIAQIEEILSFDNSNLKVLRIGGNMMLTLPNLVGFEGLEVLDLQNSFNLNDISDLKGMGIRELILDECNSIVFTSDDEFMEIFDSIDNLEKLSIKGGFNYLNREKYTFLENKIMSSGLSVKLFDDKYVDNRTIHSYTRTVFFSLAELLSECEINDLSANTLTVNFSGKIDSSKIILCLANEDDDMISKQYDFILNRDIFAFEIYGVSYDTYHFTFEIMDRKQSTFTLILRDVENVVNTNKTAIKAADGSKLIIEAYGDSSVKVVNTSASTSGTPTAGANAIVGYDIYLEKPDYVQNNENKTAFTITAANGQSTSKTGTSGAGGGSGIVANNMTIYAGCIVINGGNGGNGAGGYIADGNIEDGGPGGAGGAGGHAIVASSVVIIDANIEIIGGNAGNGGAGGKGDDGGIFDMDGDGGKGGSGGTGGYAITADTIYISSTVLGTITGGNGGKGGNGGNAGKGGTNTSYGGKGGSGGSAGLGVSCEISGDSTFIVIKNGDNGSNGSNGSSSK